MCALGSLWEMDGADARARGTEALACLLKSEVLHTPLGAGKQGSNALARLPYGYFLTTKQFLVIKIAKILKYSDNRRSELCIAIKNLKISHGARICWKPAILFIHITEAELIKIKPSKRNADNLQLLELKFLVTYSLNLDSTKLGR